jgi:hypothetical protein
MSDIKEARYVLGFLTEKELNKIVYERLCHLKWFSRLDGIKNTATALQVADHLGATIQVNRQPGGGDRWDYRVALKSWDERPPNINWNYWSNISGIYSTPSESLVRAVKFFIIERIDPSSLADGGY